MRDNADEFARHDCIVLGASFDTPDENRAFRAAQGFGFTLLSDVDRVAGRAYDVERPNSTYADYPQRYSFLIDPDGVIRRVYDVDDVWGHAQQVLADLDQLQQHPTTS